MPNARTHDRWSGVRPLAFGASETSGRRCRRVHERHDHARPNTPRRPRPAATSALLAATWCIQLLTAHSPVSRRARLGASARKESVLRPVAACAWTRSALLSLRRLSGCIPALGARLAMGWPAHFHRSVPRHVCERHPVPTYRPGASTTGAGFTSDALPDRSRHPSCCD